MYSADWSAAAFAAIPLVITTRLSILAIRYPDGHDDVPDFLPPERDGAFLMLVFAAGLLLIGARTATVTTLSTVVAVADLFSGANALLVACVLFRIDRQKTATER